MIPAWRASALLLFPFLVSLCLGIGMGQQTIESRGPIRILSDDDFSGTLLDDQGVRGGSGTAADPYRISDWRIGSEEGPALWIQNTTVHFVIQRVHASAGDGGPAVVLDGNHHARLEGLTVSGGDLVVEHFGQVDANSLHVLDSDATFRFGGQATITDAEVQRGGLALSNIRQGKVDSMVVLGSPADAVLAQRLPAAHQGHSPMQLRLSNISVEQAGAAGLRAHYAMDLDVRDVQVVGSRDAGIIMVDLGADGLNLTMENAVVQEAGQEAFVWHSSGRAFVTRSAFEASDIGVLKDRGDLTLHGTAITSNRVGLAVTEPEGLEARSNILIGNEIAVSLPAGQEVQLDLEGNFWGSGGNPGRLADQSGRNRIPAGVDYSPWCADRECKVLESGRLVNQTSAPAPVLAVTAFLLSLWGRHRILKP